MYCYKVIIPVHQSAGMNLLCLIMHSCSRCSNLTTLALIQWDMIQTPRYIGKTPTGRKKKLKTINSENHFS